jgi:hypothetical protein
VKVTCGGNQYNLLQGLVVAAKCFTMQSLEFSTLSYESWIQETLAFAIKGEERVSVAFVVAHKCPT